MQAEPLRVDIIEETEERERGLVALDTQCQSARDT